VSFFLIFTTFQKSGAKLFWHNFSIFITLPLFKNVVAKHLAPPFPKVDLDDFHKSIVQKVVIDERVKV